MKKLTTDDIKRATKLALKDKNKILKDRKRPCDIDPVEMYNANKADKEYKSLKSQQADKELEGNPTKGKK